MDEPESVEVLDWSIGDVSVRFEEGRLSGTAGINRVMGQYTLEGPRLVFGAIATTRMVGPA